MMENDFCEILTQIDDMGWYLYYSDDQWTYEIRKIAKVTLEEICFHQLCEISILMTNDQKIQFLNKNYRNKDTPTNVLSFPIDLEHDTQRVSMLGDVVLSLNTIEQEASEQKKPFKHHLTHLIIHGILHLLGYDHENEEEAQQMESIEISILSKLQIQPPYI